MESLFFSRCLRALLIYEKEYFTLTTIVIFDVNVVIAGCLDSGVIKMELKSSDTNACLLRDERTW